MIPSWVLDAACAFFAIVGFVCVVNGLFWTGVALLAVVSLLWGSLLLNRATTRSGKSVDEVLPKTERGDGEG